MASGVNLLDALQTRMGWLNGRQKLVAENVANASTPGYKPRDLAAQNFDTLLKGVTEGGGKLGMATTNSAHLQIEGYKPNAGREVVALDSETTMDGNSVVLEEQMLKMAESRMQFEAAVGFYNKSMAMMRMAIRAPGR